MFCNKINNIVMVLIIETGGYRMSDVILTSTESIPGYRVVKVLGVVSGSVVKARHLGKDILAGLRNIVGGEVKEYTELLNIRQVETRWNLVRNSMDDLCVYFHVSRAVVHFSPSWPFWQLINNTHFAKQHVTATNFGLRTGHVIHQPVYDR